MKRQLEDGDRNRCLHSLQLVSKHPLKKVKASGGCHKIIASMRKPLIDLQQFADAALSHKKHLQG